MLSCGIYQNLYIVRNYEYLAHVTSRGFFNRRGLEEGEARMLPGELVGLVDTVVAGLAKRGLVGGAEDGGLGLMAEVTLDFHGWMSKLAPPQSCACHKTEGLKRKGARVLIEQRKAHSWA